MAIKRRQLSAYLTSISIACLVAVGCSSKKVGVNGTNAQTASKPTAPELVLTEMPAGEVSTPTEIKDAALETASVVLAGRIDAGDTDPFQPGEVAFMISELPDEEHAGDDPDHADNCPFCKRKLAQAPKAIIQFLDADGKIRSGDARKTLGVVKGDEVVVTGEATFKPEIDTVLVKATGLYRMPPR
ncbi:hypothetical protein [Rhodopirellula sp. MGV]|uniref:hypothetical protein n=1 Tax=Rhodopirellula sp. MGV TaxID=2023130 RepID=UPI000B95DEA2|nr:hypothetical protein [Rhodopirellula sp. MGV]OYP33152.1 hypothetical protein CGZ80_18185 [Rhodopirellula sp. MGV]PNY35119.1 hypothetical protein C2E31_19635 [Rhodopirellula baltica]